MVVLEGGLEWGFSVRSAKPQILLKVICKVTVFGPEISLFNSQRTEIKKQRFLLLFLLFKKKRGGIGRTCLGRNQASGWRSLVLFLLFLSFLNTADLPNVG